MACKNPKCAGCSTNRILGGEDITSEDLLTVLQFMAGLIIRAYKIPEPDFDKFDPMRMVMELSGFTMAMSMLDMPTFQTTYEKELRGYVQECMQYIHSSPVIQKTMLDFVLEKGLKHEKLH